MFVDLRICGFVEMCDCLFVDLLICVFVEMWFRANFHSQQKNTQMLAIKHLRILWLLTIIRW